MRLENLTLTESFNQGGYCFVKPSEDVADEIYDWVIDTCEFEGEGVDPKDEYHCTLIYDERDTSFKITEPKEEYTATISGMDLFGEEKNILVILLDSTDLQNRNKEILDAGYEMNFPTYKPHITIKKDSNQEELGTAIKYLSILKNKVKKIILTNETWQYIED